MKKQYPLDLKLRIVSDLPHLGSVAAASRKYGISRRSISKWRRAEARIRQAVSEDAGLMRFRLRGFGIVAMQRMEKQLSLWCAEQSAPLNRQQVQEKASCLYTEICGGCTNDGGNRLEKWLDEFCRRSGLMESQCTEEVDRKDGTENK